MLRDARLTFGKETFASLSSATVNGNNVLDMEAMRTQLFRNDGSASTDVLTPDIGEAGHLEFNVKVLSIALVAAASTTLEIKLHAHTSAGASDDTVATVVTSGDVVYTTGAIVIVAGNKPIGSTYARVRIPAGTIDRFLAVSYSGTTGSLSTGTVEAWISGPSETPK